MARIPRKFLIDSAAVGAYHCQQRCVRRAFLCGKDSHTGKNYSHRKKWICNGMRRLARHMAVEFLGYTVLSNHLHLILRNRPDVVLQWTDEEVARRWLFLCPKRKDKHGRPLEPAAKDVERLLSDPDRLNVLRVRLSSISWLMRFLAEPIARRANREDNCTGRFWEGRFKCQRLLDEASLLACSMYVDLNPIRAGIAETPETSEFTAAYERVAALQKVRRKQVSVEEAAAVADAAADSWLSPVRYDPQLEPSHSSTPQSRASQQGFLPMTLAEYLGLLDATGRALRRGASGKISADQAPVLRRLGVEPGHWLETVRNFGRSFHRAVGRAEQLAAEARRHGQKWLAGVSHCRKAFL